MIFRENSKTSRPASVEAYGTHVGLKASLLKFWSLQFMKVPIKWSPTYL